MKVYQLMPMLISIIMLLLIAVTPNIEAQTLPADLVRFNAGGCIVTSEAGPPVKFILEGDCLHLGTASGNNLTLDPGGDLITDPIGNDVLPELNYDINLGMISKKYLTLHAAELWVETLVAQNTIATIGGRVLVAPTNTLTVDVTSAATTVTVKYNNFVAGDRLYMEADGKVEFMAVVSGPTGAGPFNYVVTRNLDGSSANDWYAGDAMLNTGTIGDGFIDLYSLNGVLGTGAGPTIVGNVRTGTTYNAYGPRWAIGNLNGLYNYGTDVYGTAFGDPAATNVTIDATNGFRIRSGTANRLVADTAGNLSLVGDLSMGTAGVFRTGGATGFMTGTGFWLDYNAGQPRLRIGNPAGEYMSYDTSTGTLTIASSSTGIPIGGAANDVNTHVTTISGGKITTGSITAAQVATDTLTANEIAANAITASEINAGAVTAAKISVTTLSAITANMGTITAGHINGATAEFGGIVDLNSSGIRISGGAPGTNAGYKFTNGFGMFYSGTNLHLYNDDGDIILAMVGGNHIGPDTVGVDLGTSGIPFDDIWAETIDLTGAAVVDGNLFLGGDLDWTPPTTTADDQPLVYSVGNGIVYRKTNGLTGTSCSATGIFSINWDRGIAVAVTCN